MAENLFIFKSQFKEFRLGWIKVPIISYTKALV